jgi:hypothetical protein
MNEAKLSCYLMAFDAARTNKGKKEKKNKPKGEDKRASAKKMRENGA